MKRTIFLLAGLGFALPAVASPTVPVKCGANQERVWVYDNLTTWDVNTRLKCGTTVSIEGLEKGYVKIHTADGNEGYVPTDAIPSSELAQLNAAAAAAAAQPAVVPVAAPARIQQASPQVAAQPVVQTAVQTVAIVQNAPAAPARAVPVVAIAPVNVAPAPVAPVVAVVTAPVAPAPAARPVQQSAPAPAYVPAPAQTPVPAPSAAAAAHVVAATPTPVAAPRPAAPIHTPVQTIEPTRTTVAAVTPEPRATTHASAPVVPTPRVNQTPTPRPAERQEATLVIEPATTPTSTAAREPVATVVKTADFTPLKKNSPLPASMRDVYSDDDEDAPEITVKSAQDLASCNVFFSAYGLTPMQFKWIAEDRSKKFPGVCPAPEPSMVDYVVIFTHDMNFFTTTLPDPIHTDKNGFSDWSPITAADDTMIPVSSLDKAHHEYAWVFHVRRGSFDPSKFTARRRPQFTKAESNAHASSKSIEDAVEFMSESGTSASLSQ